MKNENMTKAQLAKEFEEMRKRMMKLESGEGHHMQAEFCKETLRQSILFLEDDTGDPELADILDTPMIESLMNSFHEFAHIPLAIVDLRARWWLVRDGGISVKDSIEFTLIPAETASKATSCYPPAFRPASINFTNAKTTCGT
jgi:hypothetical protein